MNIPRKKVIEKKQELEKMYCNNCNTIHEVNKGLLLLLDPSPKCIKCGHALCNCSACKSTMELIKRGVLSC